MNDGISLIQPPHLVAQRSRRRGLPLKLDSETDLPDASSSTKSGAVLRTDCGSRAARISVACTREHAVKRIKKLALYRSVLTRGVMPPRAIFFWRVSRGDV